MYMKHFLLTLLAFLSFASFQAKRLTVNIELKNYETFLPTGTSVSDLHVYVKVADDRKGEAHITLDEMGKGSATFTRFSGGNVYCEVECPNAEMLYTTEDIYEADAGTITKVVDFAKEFHRIKFHLAGMSPRYWDSASGVCIWRDAKDNETKSLQFNSYFYDDQSKTYVADSPEYIVRTGWLNTNGSYTLYNGRSEITENAELKDVFIDSDQTLTIQMPHYTRVSYSINGEAHDPSEWDSDPTLYLFSESSSIPVDTWFAHDYICSHLRFLEEGTYKAFVKSNDHMVSKIVDIYVSGDSMNIDVPLAATTDYRRVNVKAIGFPETQGYFGSSIVYDNLLQLNEMELLDGFLATDYKILFEGQDMLPGHYDYAISWFDLMPTRFFPIFSLRGSFDVTDKDMELTLDFSDYVGRNFTFTRKDGVPVTLRGLRFIAADGTEFHSYYYHWIYKDSNFMFLPKGYYQVKADLTFDGSEDGKTYIYMADFNTGDAADGDITLEFVLKNDFIPADITAIENKSSLSAHVVNGSIIINGDAHPNITVTVTTTDGRVLKQLDCTNGTKINLPHGCYLVQLSQGAFNKVVKVVL